MAAKKTPVDKSTVPAVGTQLWCYDGNHDVYKKDETGKRVKDLRAKWRPAYVLEEPVSNPIHLAGIERLYTMSDVDRRCPSCERPFNALLGERKGCPACGDTTTDSNNIDRATARILRAEKGLVL